MEVDKLRKKTGAPTARFERPQGTITAQVLEENENDIFPISDSRQA